MFFSALSYLNFYVTKRESLLYSVFKTVLSVANINGCIWIKIISGLQLRTSKRDVTPILNCPHYNSGFTEQN